MGDTKQKPMPGHKRKSILYGVRVTCECGWESCIWYGKGASRNAHGEFAMHKEGIHRASVAKAAGEQ